MKVFDLPSSASLHLEPLLAFKRLNSYELSARNDPDHDSNSPDFGLGQRGG